MNRKFVADNTVFRPGLHSLPEFYNFLLLPAAWPLLCCAAIAAFVEARRPGQGNVEICPTEEWAMAGGFLIVPVLAILVAGFVTRIFLARFGLGAVMGVAILLPMGAAAWTGRCRRKGLVIVFILIGWFPAGDLVWLRPCLSNGLASHPLDWLIPKLKGDGGQLTLLRDEDSRVLFEARSRRPNTKRDLR